MTQICGSDGYGDIALGYSQWFEPRNFLDLGTENKPITVSLAKIDPTKTSAYCKANGYINGVNNVIVDQSRYGWGYSYDSTYKNGIIIGNNFATNQQSSTSPQKNPFIGNIYCIRVYNKHLSEEERLHNLAVDKECFQITD